MFSKTVFEELCVLQTNADEMQTQQEQDRDEKVPVFQFVPQKEREYQFELQTAEKHSVEELIPLCMEILHREQARLVLLGFGYLVPPGKQQKHWKKNMGCVH